MKPQAIETGHKPGRRGQLKRLFRAANSNIRQRVGLKAAVGVKPAATVAPGPFEAPRSAEGGNDPRHALITALLVVYPVFASVAVVLAGLWFVGSSAPL